MLPAETIKKEACFDEWDKPGGRVIEFGTVDELREQLIAQLEETLARVRGEWEPKSWEFTSKSWPFTKLGSLLLRSISVAAAIGEKMNKP